MKCFSKVELPYTVVEEVVHFGFMLFSCRVCMQRFPWRAHDPEVSKYLDIIPNTLDIHVALA